MMNNQEDVQGDELGDSQQSYIVNANNDTKDKTEVQEAPISPIEITANKRSQDEIDEEYQDEINNDMNNKYGERSGTYNHRSRKLPNLPRQYRELHDMLKVQKQLCQVHHTLLTQYGVNKGLILY